MHFSPFLLALAMCSITSPATVKAEERLANQVRSASEPVELRGLNRHERAAEKRAACSHDNVLRALLANSARASVFCSTYIHIGVTSVYVPGTTPVTTSTVTTTVTSTAYPSDIVPYLLPNYLFPYQTPSRISSACSCLSIPTPTITLAGPPTIGVTTSTAVPFTGACATETVIPGAFSLSSPSSDAFEYSIGTDFQTQFQYPDTSVPICCQACNAFNPFPNAGGGRVSGFFGNCIGWRVDANRSCTLVLQGSVGAGYLGPLCSVAGFHPGRVSVTLAKYPFAVGGRGQCASSFTAVPS